VEVKQSRPISNTLPRNLSSSSPVVADGAPRAAGQEERGEPRRVTAATVESSGSSGEELKSRWRAKGRRKRRSRKKTSESSASRRRRRRRKAREEAQVSSARESLYAVRHDSSKAIVVVGTVDGRRCKDILIDPGATSNFVRRDWALSNRLRVEELRTPLEVGLGVGQLSGKQTGGVAVKSMQTQGSSAPCTLVVIDQLSHHVILGLPWLRQAGVTLSFDEPMRWNGKLLVPTRQPATPLGDSSSPQPVHCQTLDVKVSAEHEQTMAGLLAKYRQAFSKELRTRTPEQLRRAISCHLTLHDPNARPVVSKERRKSPKEVETLIEAVKEMEAAGLIVKSESPWSSQPVLVKKYRDGVELPEKRPCWDYRAVNARIVSDAHPLPLPEDMFDKLQGSRLFSKLDLTKGFWQIPLDEASRKLLAMATPLGLYEPGVMPFGMKNAPAVFQREMQRVFRDRLYRGVMVFIDDILIYSRTAEEHAELVEWVLKRLTDEGYYAHPDKCEFFQKEVSFLGHVVSENGVAVQQHKVAAVSGWPQPRNKKDVRAFLGLTGYYRKFIPEYSAIAAPLTDLTREAVKFEWGEKEQTAFDDLKQRLTSAAVLAHPDSSRQYIVSTDASGFAISGVLMQDQPDGTRRPVAYFSRKLNPAEKRYPTHEKELLAIVRAVEHWRCYLEGSPHPVWLQSDHRSLQHLNTQPYLSDRQARWVEKLSDFEFAIHYVPGSVNVVADALSRRADYEEESAREQSHSSAGDRESTPPPRVRVTLAPIDTRSTSHIRIDEMPLRDEMKAAALRDAVYQERLSQPEPRTDGLMVGEGLLWTRDGLFYVPDDLELRRRLIHEVHDTPIGGHMGLHKTMARLTNMCWWPGMKAMIADYVRGCVTCAATKPSLEKPAGTLRPLPIPEKPWRVISIDFVGPLPRTPDYYNYILVVVDKFSKQGHFIPTTTNVTAKETAELLLNNVVRLHGLPEAIISDRGHEFVAALFQEVWKAMGTELRMSTAYHPQSDGQTERLNRELEQQLRTHANRTGSNWKQWLSVVEMHYNSDVHESTGKTPYEMNGVDWRDQWALAMRSPRAALSNDDANDLLRDIRTTWEDARQVMLKMREHQREYADRRRRDERYQVGDLVMLSTEKLAVGRGKLKDRWVGPFPVTEAFSNGVNVRLELPEEYSRLHPVFHVERLKRFVPSAVDWPNREQPDRPRAKLVDGKKKYWAVRIIGKKEEEKTFTERVGLGGQPSESSPQEDSLGAGSKEATNAEEKEAPSTRRVSPRDHASSRVKAVPPPRVKKAKTRLIKVKRPVVYYKVEWEGYDESEATWHPVEWFEDQDLQWMIDDYESQQRRPVGTPDLATEYFFNESETPDGDLQLNMMVVV
jgi:transposase InsO family protein